MAKDIEDLDPAIADTCATWYGEVSGEKVREPAPRKSPSAQQRKRTCSHAEDLVEGPTIKPGTSNETPRLAGVAKRALSDAWALRRLSQHETSAPNHSLRIRGRAPCRNEPAADGPKRHARSLQAVTRRPGPSCQGRTRLRVTVCGQGGHRWQAAAALRRQIPLRRWPEAHGSTCPAHALPSQPDVLIAYDVHLVKLVPGTVETTIPRSTFSRDRDIASRRRRATSTSPLIRFILCGWTTPVARRSRADFRLRQRCDRALVHAGRRERRLLPAPDGTSPERHGRDLQGCRLCVAGAAATQILARDPSRASKLDGGAGVG